MNRKAWIEALQYILIIVVLIVNIIGMVKIQTVIDDNQASTVEARKQNMQRQEDLKSYIKCIVLIGKTNPDVNFQTATLPQVSAILDKCAESQ